MLFGAIFMCWFHATFFFESVIMGQRNVKTPNEIKFFENLRRWLQSGRSTQWVWDIRCEIVMFVNHVQLYTYALPFPVIWEPMQEGNSFDHYSSHNLRWSPSLWAMRRLPLAFPSKVVIPYHFTHCLCYNMSLKNENPKKKPNSYKIWVDGRSGGLTQLVQNLRVG
jgi:hypothetical protein